MHDNPYHDQSIIGLQNLKYEYNFSSWFKGTNVFSLDCSGLLRLLQL